MIMTVAFLLQGSVSIKIENSNGEWVCLHGEPVEQKTPPYPSFEVKDEQMENLAKWLSRELEIDS